MTDHEFLSAMRITAFSADEVSLHGGDPLAEALRIDDLRSAYCEQLERRVARQAAEIEVLRELLLRQFRKRGRIRTRDTRLDRL